jgi:hypothetical protein
VEKTLKIAVVESFTIRSWERVISAVHAFRGNSDVPISRCVRLGTIESRRKSFQANGIVLSVQGSSDLSAERVSELSGLISISPLILKFPKIRDEHS